MGLVINDFVMLRTSILQFRIPLELNSEFLSSASSIRQPFQTSSTHLSRNGQGSRTWSLLTPYARIAVPRQSPLLSWGVWQLPPSSTAPGQQVNGSIPSKLFGGRVNPVRIPTRIEQSNHRSGEDQTSRVNFPIPESMTFTPETDQ